ncbi:MAG: methylmalonyl-CoA mutase family protein [Bacteroidales bacterium]|nr:methylmalonyl-CoA mutase family protein [Bacteroidales bacterium]
MDNEKLFSEFAPVSTEAWEEMINKDLKGADYERKLVWRTDEGFSVRPYYRAENLSELNYLDTLPDTFPFTRGHKSENNAWDIIQEIKENDLAKANAIAVESLKKGATFVTLSAKNVTSAGDLEKLLAGIDLEKFGVQFHHISDFVTFTQFFVDYIAKNNLDKDKVRGALTFDAVTHFLKKGSFIKSKSEDLKIAVQLIEMTDHLPKFKVITINGIAMHNAGATIVQELGYALSAASEYLNFGTDNGLAPEKIARKIQMALSIGSNYFMEIAKLRAIRLLWSTMVEAYHPKCNCAYKLVVNSIASSWNKTLYDPYVNMLRSTTEGMSAALGGADAIALQPFDIAYKKDDEFSRRMSRNAQIILKEEAYFDKVIDPAAGSYYVENLTNSIAECVWNQFREVESEGGMYAAIEKGSVIEAIEKSCQKRDMDIATRKCVLLGTNQYPNLNEKMADKIELEKCQCDCRLKAYRGATAFEEIRLETERFAEKNHRPKVFLLKVGNLAMRQARAGFITNFFGCAGYEIIDNSGFATVEEGVQAAVNASADVVAICSSDEEYETLAPVAVKETKAKLSKATFIVAGNPACADALKTAGVDDFIHVKVNVLETLKKYNTLLLH